MADFWLRKAELKVGDDAGDGLDLSALRITFDVVKKDNATPNTAMINVYNVARETFNKIAKEFSRVTLSAGYKDNYSLIFNGTIKQVVFYKENATDSVMVISAGDGDVAYNFAVTNATLAAGATQKDVADLALKDYAKNGVENGFIAEKSTPALPRGKVMFGASKDYLQNAAKNADLNFSVQDGKAQFVENKGTLPDDAIVLSSKSGLVGVPAQTQDGISAVCLLNPRLKIGGVVQIDESDVQSMVLNPDAVAETPPASLANDGFYRILAVQFTGDTHGNDWFCNLTLLTLDNTAADNEKVLG